MIEDIHALFEKLWDFITHIITKILNFFKHIVEWFQDPYRLQKLENDRHLVAVAIKENLRTGRYRVIDCLYNKQTGDVVDQQARGVESEELDRETKNQFGGRNMIILK
ncbi:hypothetical protein [Helicobacter salomonis]|uniref:hypothetical protein n=1 Tax=Helicobacter salomonis TaxID=56878 RepID=UPI000CF0DCBE|nr:hypothetical protein [Helicobacter salomonis]